MIVFKSILAYLHNRMKCLVFTGIVFCYAASATAQTADQEKIQVSLSGNWEYTYDFMSKKGLKQYMQITPGQDDQLIVYQFRTSLGEEASWYAVNVNEVFNKVRDGLYKNGNGDRLVVYSSDSLGFKTAARAVDLYDHYLRTQDKLPDRLVED